MNYPSKNPRLRPRSGHRPRTRSVMRLQSLLMMLWLLPGCATIQQMLPGQREAQERAEKTHELQLSVMQFADEYAGRTADVVGSYQATATRPEDRLSAQNWKLQQAELAYTIASGTNAVANVLDMIVLASLSRMVIEDYWIAEHGDERGRPLLETHRELEQGSWELLKEALTDAQAAEFREIITRWREEHPQVRTVAYVHFSDFAKAIRSPKPGKERSSGSLFAILGLDPLSGLDPAVREIAETREFAERAIFYLQRTPDLLNMQVEKLAYQFAVMPETRSMLEGIDRASLIGSAADRLVTLLPGLLASEREALLSQLVHELNEGSATVGALSGDVRSTLQAGTETASALNKTLETLDRIAARLAAPDASTKPKDVPPFDIRQYTEMIREVTAASRELNVLAQGLDATLPLVTQDAAAHVDAILGRAFLLLLVLVVVAVVATLLAALAYRAATIRMQRRNVSEG